MSAPRAVLDAIERVNWTIPCLPCNGTVEIAYDATADRVVIRHVLRHPFGADAIALAETVLDELGRQILVGDYLEDLPVHEVAL